MFISSLTKLKENFYNDYQTVMIPILAATVPFLGYTTHRVAIYKISPTHPEDLYRKTIEGETVVTVTVDILGNATDPQVESASQLKLGKAAMKAVSKWIFELTVKDGPSSRPTF
tara:strand:+ start:288 stop:629 length:342 start_codon:yes stop_codon:yes gene_type:complete